MLILIESLNSVIPSVAEESPYRLGRPRQARNDAIYTLNGYQLLFQCRGGVGWIAFTHTIGWLNKA